MTDPGIADVTYIEPLNVARMEEIIERERLMPSFPISAANPPLTGLRAGQNGILKNTTSRSSAFRLTQLNAVKTALPSRKL